LACYHEHDEFFRVLRDLKKEFPEHQFAWQMHDLHPQALSELIRYAHPRRRHKVAKI
jgi:hypothetical protein